MFRNAAAARRVVGKKVHVATRGRPFASPKLCVENVRHASSGAAGGGGGGLGKLAFATVGSTAVAVGGTIGYAAFDPDFRKLVEDSVPGSSDVLGAILGDPDGPKYTGLGVPPSKMKNLPITTDPPSLPITKKPAPTVSPPEDATNPPPPPIEEPPPSPVEEETKPAEEPVPDPVKESAPAEEEPVRKCPVEHHQEAAPAKEVAPAPPVEEAPPMPIPDPPESPVETHPALPEPEPATAEPVLEPDQDSPSESAQQPPEPEAQVEPAVEIAPEPVAPVVEEPPAVQSEASEPSVETPPLMETAPLVEDTSPPAVVEEAAVETPAVVEEAEPVKEEVATPVEDKKEREAKEKAAKKQKKKEAAEAKAKKKAAEAAAEALRKATEESQQAVGAAVSAGEACVEAISKHGQLVVSVLETEEPVAPLEAAAAAAASSGSTAAWQDVIEAAAAKSEALKEAQDKVTDAAIKLDAVEALLEKSEGGSGDDVKDLRGQLCQISEKIQSAKKESYLIEQYRDLVEEGRQQFRKEAAAILGASQDKPDHPLSQEEIDVFVTHAYKKVAALQQQLTKLQLLHQAIDQQQLSEQELRKQVMTEEVVQEELEAQKRNLDVEHQQRVAAIREEMESEMRSAMRRQAAAHNDHIKDVLEVQEMEISRKFARKTDEALAEEKANYKAELAKLSGAVDGLKTAVKERELVHESATGAQELWLACSSLQRALEAERPESGLLPLKDEVEAIKTALQKQSVKSDDAFVDAVVDSLPNEALVRGVYTDQTIRDRFFRVEAAAKRTALIGEDDSSLLLYGLSYLQSVLVVQPPSSEAPAVHKEAVDLNSLDTFKIVWLARSCVERGDLEQAVKYMTLLKGEPKNVSSEWLKEARLLLETRQACSALMSHAAAYGQEAFPPSK